MIRNHLLRLAFHACICAGVLCQVGALLFLVLFISGGRVGTGTCALVLAPSGAGWMLTAFMCSMFVVDEGKPTC